MTHPLGEGRRILGPFRGKPGCAHWGTWGPGRVPMDKDSRAFGRSYAQVVRLTWLPFQPFLTKHKSRLPTEGCEAILRPQESEVLVEFFTFDKAYEIGRASCRERV